MTSQIIGGLAKASLACIALAPTALVARTIGSASVGVNRIAGMPGSQTFLLPPSATVFETPAANLAAVLPPVGSLRASARAVAGIDLPSAALYGAVSTFGRAELPGVAAVASADVSSAISNEVFEVRSDTLPFGALVEVRFTLIVARLGSAGVTGPDGSSSISNNFDFRIQAGVVPFNSNYQPLGPTGQAGILAGGGPDPEAMVLTERFGPYAAQAAIGEDFDIELAFNMNSLARANAIARDGRILNAQSEAVASAVLLFASEVVPAGAALAAVDGPPPVAAGYLFLPSVGIRLPGLEGLEAANIQAHLLPLVHVPEPSTRLLVAIGLAGLWSLGRRFGSGTSLAIKHEPRRASWRRKKTTPAGP